MPVLQAAVPPERYPFVLDPFAGVGKIHTLENHTSGIELEPEWAAQAPINKGITIVGDALERMREWATFYVGFDAVVTSPTYGNRMADHHDAKERCKACWGHGVTGVREGDVYHVIGDPCPKCQGVGTREYKRNTYKHQLGRELSDNSSAAMQWGPEYRAFHEEAWRLAFGVIRPGGRLVLNIKSHYRRVRVAPKTYASRLMLVSGWHWRTCCSIGFLPVARIQVRTPGQRQGQNGSLRVPFEWVLVFDKPAVDVQSLDAMRPSEPRGTPCCAGSRMTLEEAYVRLHARCDEDALHDAVVYALERGEHVTNPYAFLNRGAWLERFGSTPRRRVERERKLRAALRSEIPTCRHNGKVVHHEQGETALVAKREILHGVAYMQRVNEQRRAAQRRRKEAA